MDLLSKLPPHLSERTRWIAKREHASPGNGIVYWMRTAVRLDENPALDVAKHLAVELNQPLLIYHALSSQYPFASDRHHTFILQGALDVQSACEEQGLAYAFNLEQSDTPNHALVKLANQATIVVTEDMPTDPARLFLRALQRSTSTSILAVDTACIAPMQLVGKAYERAFEFRNATRKIYSQRLSRDWPVTSCEPTRFDLSQLPFEPLPLRSRSVADWVAGCDIDHTVGPVADTRGGSTAGYARWLQFCGKGLRDYAKLRNNAAIDSVSRMSAYLHYGMVSPFRIAREAADYRTEGAEKFLDELLIWRELSYAFCFYRKDHHRISAIPAWARATLREHECDRRPNQFSWEQLARAQTGDALWDAAQQSLLKQGELHNNVRMTWGKAILQWTSNAQQALDMIIDLNHRYALDGRDPNSYGGILWCLGQFDRPFQPEQSILGTVRGRSTQEHRERIDLAKYQRRVTQPRIRSIPQVAVIGAGLSGAMAARTLSDHGLNVKIFEKSRGVGGRMATRRGDQTSFDHGAQYFTARDKNFRRLVNSWIDQGFVQAWNPRVAVFEGATRVNGPRHSPERFVGAPDMKSIARHLCQEIQLSLDEQVARVEAANHRYTLLNSDEQSLGEFDYVIAAIPAPQSASLFQIDPQLSAQLSTVVMKPCWAVLLHLDRSLDCDWDAAFVNQSSIRWIARNNTKPGRISDQESLVVHADFEWSTQHLEDAANAVEDALKSAACNILSISDSRIVSAQTHRWRYAISEHSVSHRYLSNQAGLLACGDWAAGAKVEGAFLSGAAAAGAVLRKVFS